MIFITTQKLVILQAVNYYLLMLCEFGFGYFKGRSIYNKKHN